MIYRLRYLYRQFHNPDEEDSKAKASAKGVDAIDGLLAVQEDGGDDMDGEMEQLAGKKASIKREEDVRQLYFNEKYNDDLICFGQDCIVTVSNCNDMLVLCEEVGRENQTRFAVCCFRQLSLMSYDIFCSAFAI